MYVSTSGLCLSSFAGWWIGVIMSWLQGSCSIACRLLPGSSVLNQTLCWGGEGDEPTLPPTKTQTKYKFSLDLLRLALWGFPYDKNNTQIVCFVIQKHTTSQIKDIAALQKLQKTFQIIFPTCVDQRLWSQRSQLFESPTICKLWLFLKQRKCNWCCFHTWVDGNNLQLDFPVWNKKIQLQTIATVHWECII